ncbi:MAG: OmpH family outer membrane protein, partial [Betaproteobacteria bacterium]|nr:OmpH family outer membrane protein [Betaproteobacteria bacterium]
MNSLFSIRSLALAATAGLMFAAMPASAADAKVGFVSTDRVLRDSNPAKAAQKKLETEFASKEKELQEMVARLRGLSEKLERDSATMAESERSKRQREVADMERDLQRRQREFREDLNQR